MMLRIGITGGIGSGKSTVSRIFGMLGVPVYYTDPRAKELMVSDPVVMAGIRELLGEGAYVDGALDRRFVASRIFADKALIYEVNNIVHPRVAADFERWAAACAGGRVSYVIMECAILFESGFDGLVDRVIAVSADLDERVARASWRDGIDEEQVRARIAHQLTDDEREARADYVIHNSDHDMVLPCILELHEIFTNESRG